MAAAAVPFTTAGGPASIFADLEAIQAVAEQCVRAAELGGRVGRTAVSVAGWMDVVARVSPVAARLAETLRTGAGEACALADRLTTHRDDLVRAVEAYRAAEQGAAAVVDAEDPGLLGLLPALDSRAEGGLMTDEAEFLVRSSAEVVGENILSSLAGVAVEKRIAALPPAALGPILSRHQRKAAVWGSRAATPLLDLVADAVTDHVPGMRLTPAQVWAAADSAWFLWDPTSDLPLEVVGEPQDHLGAPRRLSGRLSEVVDLIPRASDGEGSVTVTCVRGADGEDVWIVGLPGTQGGLLPQRRGENWADGGGNLDALGADSRHTAAGIAAALAAAGAPAGADVLLAGYSQGGVHAVNLAADAGFSTAYTVVGVLTVGSPNGGQTAPDTVPILEFATDRDLYTAADGGPNPVGVRRATVLFHPEDPAVLAPGTGSRQAYDASWVPGRTVVDAAGVEMDRLHELGAYTRMVEGFEAADPGQRAEVAGVHAALSGLAAGAVVSSRTVRLRRGGGRER